MNYRTVVIEALPDHKHISAALNDHGPNERLHSFTVHDANQFGASFYILIFEEFVIVPMRLQDMMDFTQEVLDEQDRRAS